MEDAILEWRKQNHFQFHPKYSISSNLFFLLKSFGINNIVGIFKNPSVRSNEVEQNGFEVKQTWAQVALCHLSATQVEAACLIPMNLTFCNYKLERMIVFYDCKVTGSQQPLTILEYD